MLGKKCLQISSPARDGRINNMNIQSIKTKADYTAALMDAKKDTPEGDKLDVLVTFIEAYALQTTSFQKYI